ncbi:ArsR family transcriptional regulator [Afipia sp. P52-10]|nr:ArsR family transcriptional regulator [Afipia sp. P52-10]
MPLMQDDQIDLVFKALAHPERRRVLALLQRRPGRSLFEICVDSIAENGQPLSRQTVSQHLEMLERAGLLDISWQGRTKAHAANLAPLRKAAELAINPFFKKGS